MAKPEKLIITSTVAPSWIYPDAKNNPKTADDAIEEGISAWKAGAAVVHIHGRMNFTEDEWKRVIKTLRDKTDVVIQVGLSALRIDERMPVIKMKPDMLSIIANHHDESFPNFKMSLLHDTEELEDYSRLCTKYGIRPEWEVWHAGSVWNLNYLVSKGLIKPPHFVTLFFEWPGGIWSPATAEELLHRLKQQREDSICSVSIMSPAQTTIAAMSLLLGHHLRIGTEDNPYYFPDRLAKDSGELVARMVRIAKEVGREVAKPDDARKAIGVHNS
ncbi:MAG: 3-keto-5-aminohexanoate cleavage protein [Thaumarchaeota archaeon]|nr:3-keto-5-aminohexanoate cleavage protein [Nitrososphaerota archaeon]